MSSNSDSIKLAALACTTAAASSLLTYAVFRWHHRKSINIDNHDVLSPQRELALLNGNGIAASVPKPRRRADPFDPTPRSGYLSWDDYFMAVAFLSAQRSKDPNKQVGACIVDQQQVICGIGYNGFPRGCSDGDLPWAKKDKNADPLNTKYPYVCHAEMNAILNKNGASVVGAKMYVTMFPCNECAKLLIQAGIKEIIFHEDKSQPRPETPAPGAFKLDQQYAASKRLLSLAGVKVRQHLFQQTVTLRLTNDGGSIERGMSVDVSSDGYIPNGKDDQISPALAVLLNSNHTDIATQTESEQPAKALQFD